MWACIHRGGEIGTETCQSCGGNIQIKVFSCSKHIQCTLAKRLDNREITPGVYGVCSGCADRQSVSTEWQAWVMENLARGSPVEQLVGLMVQNGIPHDVARTECDELARSPWRRLVGSLTRRLAKRDWLLDSLRTVQAEGVLTLRTNDIIEASAAIETGYRQNRPVHLVREPSVSGWPAISWTHDVLVNRIGSASVEVQAGRESDPDYERHSDRHKHTMPFDQFMRRCAETTNDIYLTANNAAANREALGQLVDDIGRTPHVTDTRSGYLWIGPKGVYTPLHHDLTNNLMVQFCGRKRVRLISSLDLPRVGNDAHCYTRVKCENLAMSGVRVSEVVIDRGDVLFLPVGWWHDVLGLDPSIGMSFTALPWPNQFAANYSTYGEL